ncbi:MAG: class I SAM-dependent methyltransferase [Pseudomonadota bacterium]
MNKVHDYSAHVVLVFCDERRIWLLETMIGEKPRLGVLFDQEYAEKCRMLSSFTHRPLVDSHDGADLLLKYSAAGLSLQGPEGQSSPFQPSLESRPRIGRDPLLRAIHRQNALVWDLTCGWARDAVHLAYCGMQVVAVERDTVVYSLVADAIDRCQKRSPEAVKRFALHCLTAEQQLEQQTDSPPDVIYLDPMYPSKRNSASASRPAQLLQSLCNPTDDLEFLIEKSIATARYRVVVKRPHFAPVICPQNATGSVSGKRVRFDIYPSGSMVGEG